MGYLDTARAGCSVCGRVLTPPLGGVVVGGGLLEGSVYICLARL
jgi:hypothetical protein